jgi:hypothetical protein
MKNASLLLSTALASLIVLAPATLTSADAATHQDQAAGGEGETEDRRGQAEGCA